MPTVTECVAETYARDGFLFPVDVMDEAQAKSIRADLEQAEAQLHDDPEKLMLARSYADRLLPSFDRLIRHPDLLDAVRPILGPDLLVWSCGLFIKESLSTQFVTWHQDLTYWGLDDSDEVTAWVALSPATTVSGCMRFIPGSHRRRSVPHVDTYDANNLLTRGQEIAVEVNENEAVDVILEPGQASLHHGHLFHSSGPTGHLIDASAPLFVTSGPRCGNEPGIAHSSRMSAVLTSSGISESPDRRAGD